MKGILTDVMYIVVSVLLSDTKKFWISFCIWATELESGISCSDAYSSTRPNRARDVELDELDIELHNHPARHQIRGTSKRNAEICKVRGLSQVLHELFLWNEESRLRKAEEGQEIRNPFRHIHTH